MTQSLVDRTELIWKSFCDAHQRLYMVTCEEYQLLVSGGVGKLEEKIENKKGIIEEIKSIEFKREKLIADINATIENEDKKIKNASDLLTYYKESEPLQKYHKILLAEIKKIQNQGKKNKIFINLAMGNLRTIKQDIAGKDKKLETYDRKGLVF